MLKLKLSVMGIGLFSLVIFGYVEVWGADWKLYNASSFYWAYFDAQNITRPSKNVVRVWLKWDYTKEGVIGWVGKFGKEYENLSHTNILYEIDCVEKKLRQLTSTEYDHKGTVISSGRLPSEWDFIIPESMNETLYKEVCK